MGQFPGDPRDDYYLTTGPLCRYSEDLIPMLEIMAGPDNSAQLNLSNVVDLKSISLRVFRYQSSFVATQPLLSCRMSKRKCSKLSSGINALDV